MKYLTALMVMALLVSSCSNYKRKSREQGDATVLFDLQGHRGARGLAPENTIPGFWKALSVGVTTLELDLAVTKDRELMVSHEPWMSHVICKDSTGGAIAEAPAMSYNIHQMTYQEVMRFDCGSRGNPMFPEQEATYATKPRFVDVIRSSEDLIRQKGLIPVYYNIEIKSRPESDNLYHPAPDEFSTLVYNTLKGLVPLERVTIQSFDVRVLQYFNTHYPEVSLVYLVGDYPFELEGKPYPGDQGLQANLDLLGFIPQVYSPYYKLLDEEILALTHEQGMLVVPWTVNEIAEMERLYDWGVDGLITDYPNRFWETRIAREDVILE